MPSDDSHTRDILDQARGLGDRGREALQRGACDAAFVQVRQARDMILRALRSHEGEPDAAAVDRAIDETARFIEAVSQRVPTESGAARSLLEGAGWHLQQARDQRQQQRLRAALAETRVARNLALRAERLATGQH